MTDYELSMSTYDRPLYFAAKINISGVTESYDKKSTHYVSHLDNDILESFSKSEKSTINSAYDSFCSKFSDIGTDVCMTTLFCDGEVSITADKEFGGIKAGDDLKSLFVTYPYPLYISEEDFEVKSCSSSERTCPIDEVFEKGCSIGEAFAFEIGNPDLYSKVKDYITLTLSIPVKSGLYFQWALDKAADPEAEMSFTTDKLEGKMIIPWNILPKDSI